MNRLSREKQIEVTKCLCEGMSISATVRLTGVAMNTVMKLLVDLGEVCEEYHDRYVRNLNSRRIQCDELWAFVGKKDRNCTPAERDSGKVGSAWTFTAIDADSKLCVSYLVAGGRDAGQAYSFMRGVASRVANRIQLTTDAHSAYFTAVREAFGENNIDYAMLVKKYGPSPNNPETRYSPAECTGIEKKPKFGEPDYRHISTSYVERSNLSVRMSNRRFTRLTNAFSKKMVNLQASVALYFMHYNFVRIHKTLRCTPAMEAGVTKKLWDVSDIVDLLNPNNWED